MPELPSIYLYAFLVTAFVHLFFMQKESDYDIAYLFEYGNNSGYGQMGVTVTGGEPSATDLQQKIADEIVELNRGKDLPQLDSDKPKIVVLNYQRSDYRWTYKAIWKR